MATPYEFRLAREHPKEYARAMIGCVFFFGIAIGMNALVKYKNKSDPVTATQARVIGTHVIWQESDKRAILNETVEFVTAANAQDSSFAKEQHLSIAEFKNTSELVVSKYIVGNDDRADPWSKPEHMNYVLGNSATQ